MKKTKTVKAPKAKKVKKVSKQKALRDIEKHLPKAYRPLTGWGYLFSIVLIIPVLNWIVAAKAKNRNRSNLARMWSILEIVAVVAVAALELLKVTDFLPFI